MFRAHFSFLKKVDVDDVIRKEGEILKPWLRYFNFLSTKTRTGRSSQIPQELGKLLQNCTPDSPEGYRLITFVLCMLKHHSVPSTELILEFNVSYQSCLT